MKILLLNDDYPPYASNSVAQIAATQAGMFEEQGHSVTVLTTHRVSDDTEIRSAKNISSIPVSYRASLRHFLSVKNPKVRNVIKRIMEDVQPDVILAHNIHSYLTYDALSIARSVTDNVFITMHDVMSFSFGRLATKKYLDSKGAHKHVSTKDQWKQAGLMWNPLRNRCIRKALQSATKVIAVSEDLEEALHANGIQNTTVIHHGIDTDTWNASDDAVKTLKETYGLADKKIILFGGRISIDKGSVALLRALDIVIKQEPNAVLLIVGEKKRWGELMNHAQASSQLRDHCVCTGWTHPEELPIVFHACDIVTTPSLCLDTFNLMNLEAMAAQKPVVGTLFGGTPEVVQHGKTGFICDPRDTDTYASYLIDLLSDPQKAHAMGQAGKVRAQEQFSLRKNIDALQKLFTE